MCNVEKMAACVTTVFLVLFCIALHSSDGSEGCHLHDRKYPYVFLESFSTPFLPRYSTDDAFSHLRHSRKKVLMFMKTIQIPRKRRNDLLLRCGDVERNPGPCATVPQPTKEPQRKTLRIVHLNARSLIHKFDDVVCLMKSVLPEVLAISETWLDSSVPDGEIEIPGYSVFRCDRSGRGGGVVAVYCAEHLSCTVLSCGTTTSGVEYLWTSIGYKPFSSFPWLFLSTS